MINSCLKRGLKTIDFRSDTVTKPSQKMLEAMVSASLGDDVYGEDPTINQLQKMCAEMFRKEAALFVPTGTMGNLVSVLTHCKKGEAVILGQKSHIAMYEQGGISSLASVFPSQVPNLSDGTLCLKEVESKLYPDNPHFCNVTAVALENTQNVCGGKVVSLEYQKQLSGLAKSRNLKVHLDGSRIMNAYGHLKELNPSLEVSALGEGIDSINMCFSKGLRCPVGSVVIGTEKFIKKALRWRKALGGGMRQAGVLAAACIEALHEAPEVVESDHQKAKKLAKGLQEIGFKVEHPQTNIVNIWPPGNWGISEVADAIKEVGVLIPSRPFKDFMRAIPHSDTSDSDIEEALHRIQKVIN